MIRKMLKKSPNKISSMIFVIVFGSITLLCNLLGFRLSTIYLILIAGLTGLYLYSVPGGRGERK